MKEDLRLNAVAERLQDLLGVKVIKADEVVGPEVEGWRSSYNRPGDAGECRFHPGEENDRHLAQQYAKLADVFVSDAFGTVHRAHASNSGVAEFLPAVAGFLMQRKLKP